MALASLNLSNANLDQQGLSKFAEGLPRWTKLRELNVFKCFSKKLRAGEGAKIVAGAIKVIECMAGMAVAVHVHIYVTVFLARRTPRWR